MCKPLHYGIFYEINPWMHMDEPATQTKAQEQWQCLYETLLRLNVIVKLIEPIKGLPDMVFTANAGLVYQQQVWISSFKATQRQPESQYFEQWFLQEGFDVINQGCDFSKAPAFEGAGDGLFFYDQQTVFQHTLVGAYGIRSDADSYENSFFKQFNLTLCELVDPYFYHLDTCFCPLNASLALWYPNAFSDDSQQRLVTVGQLIAIPEMEARRFACNAVVVGQHVVIPSGCPETTRLLEAHGFTVHSCEMSEFVKAGGACKCLTLQI